VKAVGDGERSNWWRPQLSQIGRPQLQDEGAATTPPLARPRSAPLLARACICVELVRSPVSLAEDGHQDEERRQLTSTLGRGKPSASHNA
jgi:hypothetical protein